MFKSFESLLAGEEVVGAEETAPRRSKGAITHKGNTFLLIANFHTQNEKQNHKIELLWMKGVFKIYNWKNES